MNALTTTPRPHVRIHEGQAITLSTEVARVFGKRHNDVLRAIQNLLPQLPPEHLRNFAQMVIDVEIGSGATRKSPAYKITRDGFTLLAIGFTGKRALAFKLAYIDAFNRMEAELTKPPTPLLTQGVDQDAVDEIIRVTTGNLVHFLKNRRCDPHWGDITEALLDVNTTITFPELLGLMYACLNRMRGDGFAGELGT